MGSAMAGLTATLEQLLARRDLSEAEADRLLRALADENLPPPMAAALLGPVATPTDKPA